MRRISIGVGSGGIVDRSGGVDIVIIYRGGDIGLG